jgi:FKBP-type peptidyl-prolyl cis-trans isomerase
MGMKGKRMILWSLSLALAALVSCDETDNSTEQWRKNNQAAYDRVKDDPAWTLLDADGGPDGVYYKDVTEQGTEIGNEYPEQTSSVVVNYTAKYYNEEAFDSGKKSTFGVNEVVRGFSVALQNMRVGQKWEICVPFDAGYGTSGAQMQAYSTLFFDIELLQITKHPK